LPASKRPPFAKVFQQPMQIYKAFPTGRMRAVDAPKRDGAPQETHKGN
jgi:hypothetical protein